MGDSLGVKGIPPRLQSRHRCHGERGAAPRVLGDGIHHLEVLAEVEGGLAGLHELGDECELQAHRVVSVLPHG